MHSYTPISNIMEQNIFWLQKRKCSSIQKVSFPTYVSPETACTAHFVCVSKKGIKMNVALILWTLMSSWELTCPGLCSSEVSIIAGKEDVHCNSWGNSACGATCWIWDFPPLALGHISLWGDEEDSCVGSCERKIMGFLVQSVIKSHLFLCIEVLVALGILYQSAALVAVTAGGDKDCQNEILLPLERPFTGQHS